MAHRRNNHHQQLWPARTAIVGSASASTLFLPLLLISLLAASASGEPAPAVRQLCQSVTKSCGECIGKHASCAWCADPSWNGTQRCDAKWVFAKTGGLCGAGTVHSPSTEIKLAPQHNLPIGGKRIDGITVIQLEPQQVEVRMKPGDVVEVPFHYLHKPPVSGYEVRDFTIQTSEFRSLGLDVEFSIDCAGSRVTGRVCPNVQPDQRINFYAKIQLRDCSNPSQMAVSIGIYGYNTVSAIYIHPICGCDCEQPRSQERRSPRCGYRGNLVCGQCQCDQGLAGDQCECDLNKYGVSSPADLLNKCKEHRLSAVCSGHGRCACGKCECDGSHLKGRFCECDNGNCPLSVEGKMCSGRGVCDCGRCLCEPGWVGEDCGCADDPSPCTERGVVCSNNGLCECGRCACNVGWTGPTCSIEQPMPVEGQGQYYSSSTTTKSAEPETELLPEDDTETTSRQGDEEEEDENATGSSSTPSAEAAAAAGGASSSVGVPLFTSLLLLVAGTSLLLVFL